MLPAYRLHGGGSLEQLSPVMSELHIPLAQQFTSAKVSSLFLSADRQGGSVFNQRRQREAFSFLRGGDSSSELVPACFRLANLPCLGCSVAVKLNQ